MVKLLTKSSFTYQWIWALIKEWAIWLVCVLDTASAYDYYLIHTSTVLGFTGDKIMNSYTVTVENFEGKCKRVKVTAANGYEAMATAQKNGWYAVDVEQSK